MPKKDYLSIGHGTPSETYTISITWSTLDVHFVASDLGIKLSDSEARDILKRAYENHDANVGINWSVLEELILNL